jgi:molecular chaperone GrpE
MGEEEPNKRTNGTGEEQEHESAPVPELPAATQSAIQMEELQQQIEQLKDLLLRKAAEFENYKRRVENESIGLVKFATESLIVDLLPVLDDLERSLKHSKESKDFESFVKGIELIGQKLLKILETRGLRSFETEGKEFDVNVHDALMQVPRPDVPPHTVIEEVEKGYMLNDKVIRHAKVIVSTAEREPESTANKASSDSDSTKE